MKRLQKIMCLLLTVLMVVSALPGTAMAAETEDMHLSRQALDMLKFFEGFLKYPVWDYGQYSVGYGTYCPDDKLEEYRKNGITEEEAEALLWEYVGMFEDSVNGFAKTHGLTFTQSQFDALLLFTYNCGAGWMYNAGNMRQAVLSGATGMDFVNAYVQWCSAGGSVLSGLVNRRMIEANLYLNGEYGTSTPAGWRYVKLSAAPGTIGNKVMVFRIGDNAEILWEPVLADMVFDGWYTEKDGGTAVTVLDQSIPSGTTLYAHYVPEEPEQPEEPQTPPTTEPETPVETEPAPTEPPATEPPVTEPSVTEPTEPEVTEPPATEPPATEPPEEIPEEKPEETPPVKPVPEEPGEQPEKEDVEPRFFTVSAKTGLNVRRNPGMDQEILTAVPKNTTLVVADTKEVDGETWGYVGGGWVSMKHLTEKDTTTDLQNMRIMRIKECIGLNFRRTPGLKGEIMASLPAGTLLCVYSEKEASGLTWANCGIGWVCADYLENA